MRDTNNLLWRRKGFTRITLLFLLMTFFVKVLVGQQKWTQQEKKYYATIAALCGSLQVYSSTVENRDSLFRKYIYLDYVFSDTDQSRINRRINLFDTLIKKVFRFIDSVGLENLDAQPLRLYKNDSLLFKPFQEGLEKNLPSTLAYFDKRNPGRPIGYLLFDEKTSKLISWILIKQGDSYYFFTFNLI